MFWAGRVNAVLAIVAAVGVVICWAVQGPAGAAGWLIIMVVIRVSIRILDVIWTALTGDPLIYQVKVLDRRTATMRKGGWRSIGAVLMFPGEALFSARQGAANQDAPPDRMPAQDFLDILARSCQADGEEPPPAA